MDKRFRNTEMTSHELQAFIYEKGEISDESVDEGNEYIQYIDGLRSNTHPDIKLYDYRHTEGADYKGLSVAQMTALTDIRVHMALRGLVGTPELVGFSLVNPSIAVLEPEGQSFSKLEHDIHVTDQQVIDFIELAIQLYKRGVRLDSEAYDLNFSVDGGFSVKNGLASRELYSGIPGVSEALREVDDEQNNTEKTDYYSRYLKQFEPEVLKCEVLTGYNVSFPEQIQRACVFSTLPNLDLSLLQSRAYDATHRDLSIYTSKLIYHHSAKFNEEFLSNLYIALKHIKTNHPDLMVQVLPRVNYILANLKRRVQAVRGLGPRTGPYEYAGFERSPYAKSNVVREYYEKIKELLG